MMEFERKQHSLFIIFILILSSMISLSLSNQFYPRSQDDEQTYGYKEKSPMDILKFSQKSDLDNKLNIDINNVDPLNFLRMQKEIENLYLKPELEEDNRYKLHRSEAYKLKNSYQKNPNKNFFPNYKNFQNKFNKRLNNFDKFRFAVPAPSPPVLKPFIKTITQILPPSEADLKLTPADLGEMGIPQKKEYNDLEENVEIANVIAESNYIKYGPNREVQTVFDAKNVLTDVNFWCSTGNHDLKEEVKFFAELKHAGFISSMWVFWAFAPGEWSVKYSNDKKKWSDLFGGFKLSIKEGNLNWWKSVLSDPKKRWEYRSFDERISFDEPFFAKYIEITMRIPVNQFFGLYQIEFYARSKSIVMIKSKSPGTHLCLSTSNGLMTNYTPVWAIDCLQAISYGDNREIWVVQTNGFITSYNQGKCMESPNDGVVDIIDCGKSSDFKDQRDQWVVDYDGKIRSLKEKFTCLSMVDSSFGDMFIDFDNMKASASSSQSDGNHSPEQPLDKNSLFYWASNPSTAEVVYELYFPKYSIFIKNFNLNWKFPAKKFKVMGLLPDGYWKTFYKTKKNRETDVNVNFMNYDVVGLKILMQDSTTKVENKNVYGLQLITINTGARFLKREPCQDLIGNINLWEVVYSYNINDTVGKEYKKAWAKMHITRNKFSLVKGFYVTIPNNLVQFKENAIKIKKKISIMDARYNTLEHRLLKFEDILSKGKSDKNTIGSNVYFPAYDCSHIIKSFPSKRSGFYFIKNECMFKPQKVFCDFDTYEKKNGLDYLIYTDGNVINTPIRNIKNLFDVRLMCNKIGMEPIEIKNNKMLEIIVNLMKEFGFDFSVKNVIPLGYDYSCDVANCSKIYRSFNDLKTGDLNDIFKIYEKHSKSSPIVDVFEKTEADPDAIVNISGIGKNMQVVNKKLATATIVGFVCSTNKDGSKSSNSYINIDCDDNIRGERWSNLELFSHVKFVCPRECSLIKSPVYGTDIYTDNSSICRAAVHCGALVDSEGGIVTLTVHKGQKNYSGSSAHNVSTLDYPNEWDRSYKVEKFQPYCPIDKMKDYANSHGVSSFLSIEETENFGNNVNYMSENSGFFNGEFNPNGQLYTKEDFDLTKGINNFKNKNKENYLDKQKHENTSNDYLKSLINNNKKSNHKIGRKFIKIKLRKNPNNPIALKEINSQINFTNKNEIQDFIKNSEQNNENNSRDEGNSYNENPKNKKKFNSSEKFKVISQFLDFINNKNGNKMLRKTNELNSLVSQYDQIKHKQNKNPINFSFKEKESSNSENFLLAQNYKSGYKSRNTNSMRSENSDSDEGHQMTTEDALISINSINSKDFKSIDLMKKFANAFKSMVGQAASGCQILLADKLIGLKSLKRMLKIQYSKLDKLEKLLLNIDVKSKQILDRIKHIGRKLKAKINKMNRRTDFVEDYNSINIKERYLVFNSLTGKGQPAKWDYSLLNLNGHFKTISQKGSFIDGRSGSHLIIRNRDFYDFEARFSVLINDDNTFGVAFRYKDPFNYYIFEISNQGKGFKRIRKIQFAKSTTIDIKYDGGYVKATWYNIKIRALNSNYKIYMTTDNSANMEKHYDLVFEFSDNVFINGTLSFASYGISSLMIDNISIIHIKCSDFNDNPNKIQMAQSANCSRHWEKFKSDYVKRWKKIDPLEYLNGPSNWVIRKLVDDRKNVLAQITNIQGLSMYEEGSIFLLNLDDKVCKKGKINIKFKSLDDGIVGIIFKYNHKGDFYTLEVSGEKESFVRIRKRINGKFSLIGIKQLLGFNKNNWTRLILKTDGDKFNAYITKGDISNDLLKVFDQDLKDTDLENGKFGFSTFKNRVFFDEFFTSSFDDEEIELDDKLYKLNENIPGYTWGKCLKYSNSEERNKHCQIISHTEAGSDKCKFNYCNYCCDTNTSSMNVQQGHLCKKQCNALESPSDKNKNYSSCYEPKDNDSSIYPFCDKQFDQKVDFYDLTRCKKDMCNLCCASFEFVSKTKISRLGLNSCYKGCLEKFDKIDNKS